MDGDGRQLQRASHQRELQLPNPMSGGEGDLRTTKRRRTVAGTSSGARLASARSARGLPHLRLPIPMSGGEGNRPAHDEEEMDDSRFHLQRAAQLREVLPVASPICGRPRLDGVGRRTGLAHGEEGEEANGHRSGPNAPSDGHGWIRG